MVRRIAPRRRRKTEVPIVSKDLDVKVGTKGNTTPLPTVLDSNLPPVYGDGVCLVGRENICVVEDDDVALSFCVDDTEKGRHP
jgi:hypothetical protein